MATPIVPARPARASAGPTAVKEDLPHIPPRPVRHQELAQTREDYTRSPLNDLPSAFRKPSSRGSSRGAAPSDIPPRPPSVSLPSIGQEGTEYASYDQLPPEAHGVGDTPVVAAPQQTRNVSSTMKLHAPKASVPQATATSRIETVTGTDSTQAAAAGIGRAQPEDDVHRAPGESNPPLARVPSRTDYHIRRVASTDPHLLSQRAHSDRSSSSLPLGPPKAASIHEGPGSEHGIPEIGRQIPLYRNAGDVQAPAPAQALPQHAPGIGFFNDGSSRAHHRKRSSRHQFGPPDSYGMHGHGQEPHDHFERDWAAKHPKEVAMEGYNVYGHFHHPRPAFALSTEELNKIVTQSSGNGVGTSNSVVGTPSWEVANQATTEYMARYSPRPPPISLERAKRRSSGSQPPIESPLRHSISAPQYAQSGRFETAIVSDDGTIHINEPERNLSHVAGKGPADGTLDLGPKGGNTAERGGWFEERGDGTPILASDEILKRPGSAYMHPAVSPEFRPTGDEHYDSSDHGHDSPRSSFHLSSRPSSRPSSVHGGYHGGNLHRFVSHDDHHGSGVHTPLEEIEEYEPLFPEEEANVAKPKAKALLKRPGWEHHHFPSQDIWEDTPMSLQYQTTVDTPDLPHGEPASTVEPSASTFETPEQEQKRRAVNTADMLSDAKMVSKPHFRGAVQGELERPGLQRFPSQDIWEDTPDSMRLVTTVSGPQVDELQSPPDGDQDDENPAAQKAVPVPVRPTIPSRPQRKSKLAEEVKPENVAVAPDGNSPPNNDNAAAGAAEKASSPTKADRAPQIPERPKPVVPARPIARTLQQAGVEGAALDASAGAAPPALKPKPVVPARPGGEKLAALKAGFMNDLNQRLKLGPQGPAPSKANEPDVAAEAEAVKAPLEDARKGRAKGPARRRPAAVLSAVADTESGDVKSTTETWGFSTPVTVWHLDHSAALHVPGFDDLPPTLEKTVSPTEHTELPEQPSTTDESASVADATSTVDTASPSKLNPVSPLETSDAGTADTPPLPSPDVRQLESAMSSNVASNTVDSALTQPVSHEQEQEDDHPEEGVGETVPDTTESIDYATKQEDAATNPADEPAPSEEQPALEPEHEEEQKHEDSHT